MDSSVANEGGERHKLAEGYSRRQKSPPRQPRNFRPTPSRSPSPLPLPSEPLPEYLAIAFQTPSVMAQSATRRDGQHRKLLILDLNGTLLVRTTRGTPYPRPFMPNFRDYLFHKETRKWLDVMVWSSAQPFNVDKMVRRCFFSSSSNTSLHGAEPAPVATGDEWEGKLLAVWARDTLGLSSHAYGRKTQTTKDLAKPWSQVSGGSHSALTTILLDDSPLKARLQPYNHLCVPEYIGRTREKDLGSKKSVMKDRLERLEVANRFVDEQSETGSDMSISSTNSHSDVGDAKFTTAMTDREKAAAKQAVLAPDADAGYAKSTPTMSAKQIKRGEKKERKKREAAVAKDALLAPDISIASEHHPGIFDETLLAVIGILDEMKPQENVAAWVKHGGLWADKFPSPDCTIVHDDERDLGRPGSPTDAEIDDDGEPHALPPPSSQPTATSSSPPSSPSSKSESPSKISKRQRSINSDDRSEVTKKGRLDIVNASSALNGCGEAAFATGNDNESQVTFSKKETDRKGSSALKYNTHPSSEIEEIAGENEQSSLKQPTHNLWFEHPETLMHWVKRGRSALHNLGIREDDGIEMDHNHFAETYKH